LVEYRFFFHSCRLNNQFFFRHVYVIDGEKKIQKRTEEKTSQPSIVILKKSNSTYNNKIMRVYLVIISFVLFICTVSSRSVLSSSDEDQSNEVQQEPNRPDINEILTLLRLHNLLDDDEKNTDGQFVQEGNESDEDNDDDTSNTGAAEDVRKKRQLSDDEDDEVPNDISENDQEEQLKEQIFQDEQFDNELDTNESNEEPFIDTID